MVGAWTGAPNVSEAVDQGVDAAAQGKKVNDLARGFAKFAGQALANATMSIEIEFKLGGTVFFRGNTDLLNLPKDSDGTWSVAGDSLDQFDITFGTSAKKYHGKILFRNKDEFSLKLDDESIAAIAAGKPAKEAPKDPPKDGSKEAPKETAKPPAPDLASIVFKRKGE
jgi:hypothetical protein